MSNKTSNSRFELDDDGLIVFISDGQQKCYRTRRVAFVFNKRHCQLCAHGPIEYVAKMHWDIMARALASSIPAIEKEKLLDDIVVISSEFDVDDLNKAITVPGYAKLLLLEDEKRALHVTNICIAKIMVMS